MLGRTTGAVLVGVDAQLIQVEVYAGGGLPNIAAVGLPDSAVREGVDRIRAAMHYAGIKLPPGRITVNLAPADIRKQGATLDLPMAVALLVAAKEFRELPRNDRTVIAGELALDGTLRPVRGMLSIALASRLAGKQRLIVPRENADEASLVEGIDVLPVSELQDIRALSRGLAAVHRGVDGNELLERAEQDRSGPDLAEVKGQALARRAMEIAAAGGHHLLLIGPPGSGKTMMARRLPGILPPMTSDEALAVTQVWSAVGISRGLVTERPFRAPHHGISFVGLTGGGRTIRPGEISLATHGVLYLDELTEFKREALEALRQPLEDGTITVTRLKATATLPARFSLIASMNPCRCGHHGSPAGKCRCTPNEIRRYLSCVSGPLLDRIDLVVEVPAVDLGSLSAAAAVESTRDVRRRVVAARRLQAERLGPDGPPCNAQMTPAHLGRFVRLDAETRRALLLASRRLGLSARGFDRVRRVARTIADLQGDGSVTVAHVAEAVQYRQRSLLSTREWGRP